MSVESNSRATLAAIISDYRANEIAPPDAAHVDRWVSQFPANVQDAIVDEMIHVMGKTYFSRNDFQTFIDGSVTNPEFAGSDAVSFWKGVHVLAIQTAGNSQRAMVAMLDESLRRQCGISLAECGSKPHTYLYLDDCLFSGGRIHHDLKDWIERDAPKKANVEILTIANHSYGEWYTGKKLEECAQNAGRQINFVWRRCVVFENRKSETFNSDVLRPTVIPDDPNTQAYIANLARTPIIRTKGGKSPLAIFSGEDGRHLLEQQFLVAGVRVREMCPYLNQFMRPLGNIMFDSFGFGSTIVTYRNCPNNAPLVFWAGNPWYPLFPRKTN